MTDRKKHLDKKPIKKLSKHQGTKDITKDITKDAIKRVL